MSEFFSINPIAFELFGFKVHWYGVIIATGVLVGFFLANWDIKRRRIKGDIATDMVIWAMIPAIIFARLYYVIFDPNPNYPTFLSVIDITKGGLAIYGGVIGGAIGLFVYSLVKKIKLTTLLDIAAPSLAIGQAFGRWGNFVNQEAFGNAVSNPKLQWFPYAVFFDNPKGDPSIYQAGAATVDGVNGYWVQATFFYESMWCLLICGFLILYRNRQHFKGELVGLYFALYGLERCLVELLRTDQLWIPGTRLPVSSVLSGALLIASLSFLIFNYIRFKQGKIHPNTPGSKYWIEPVLAEAQPLATDEAPTEENSEKNREEAPVSDDNEKNSTDDNNADSTENDDI